MDSIVTTEQFKEQFDPKNVDDEQLVREMKYAQRMIDLIIDGSLLFYDELEERKQSYVIDAIIFYTQFIINRGGMERYSSITDNTNSFTIGSFSASKGGRSQSNTQYTDNSPQVPYEVIQSLRLSGLLSNEVIAIDTGY